MSDTGARGKWSEAEVKKQLNLYGRFSSFAHYRLPDRRAGSRAPTLADFQTMHQGRYALLEIKEVETHDYRLPHTNYDELKVARARSWAMAGADAHVLVCFRPGASAIWRYAPLDYFIKREGGSWDMRDIATLTLPQAMEIMYGPPPSSRT